MQDTLDEESQKHHVHFEVHACICYANVHV